MYIIYIVYLQLHACMHAHACLFYLNPAVMVHAVHMELPLETGASDLEMELYVSGRYLSCTKPTSNTNSSTLSQIVATPGVGYRMGIPPRGHHTRELGIYCQSCTDCLSLF